MMELSILYCSVMSYLFWLGTSEYLCSPPAAGPDLEDPREYRSQWLPSVVLAVIYQWSMNYCLCSSGWLLPSGSRGSWLSCRSGWWCGRGGFPRPSSGTPWSWCPSPQNFPSDRPARVLYVRKAWVMPAILPGLWCDARRKLEISSEWSDVAFVTRCDRVSGPAPYTVTGITIIRLKGSHHIPPPVLLAGTRYFLWPPSNSPPAAIIPWTGESF